MCDRHIHYPVLGSKVLTGHVLEWADSSSSNTANQEEVDIAVRLVGRPQNDIPSSSILTLYWNQELSNAAACSCKGKDSVSAISLYLVKTKLIHRDCGCFERDDSAEREGYTWR